MKVSELAEELGVPASTILEQCQRFGIDASWAGAELAGADTVILRAELAEGDELDLTPADPLDAPGPAVDAEPVVEVAAGTVASTPGSGPTGQPSALPPTAVGSRPDLIDAVTPEPEPEAPSSRGPGFQAAGGGGGASIDPSEVRSIPPREPPAKRHLDRSARNAAIALGIGVVLLAASNLVDLAAVIAALWVLGIVALAVAIVDAVKGRRHALTHPERTAGLWLSMGVLVLSIAALIGVGVAISAVIGDAPAAEAPMNVGDLAAVQSARWGYQRLSRIADNDWMQPARGSGTCWTSADYEDPRRSNERVEVDLDTKSVSCVRTHTMEVSKVFAINRDADAPYPGAKALKAVGLDRCGPTAVRLQNRGIELILVPEYPTATGWDDGDHDVACVLVTDGRTGALLD